MNRTYLGMDGCIYNHSYTDWEGNPTERTPDNARYTFEPYVVYKLADKYQHVDYSDRLFQFDPDKYNELCKKHFNNESQAWDRRDVKSIESFLRDYHDDQKLELVGVMHGCNVGNGFPYWMFMFNDGDVSE